MGNRQEVIINGGASGMVDGTTCWLLCTQLLGHNRRCLRKYEYPSKDYDDIMAPTLQALLTQALVKLHN